MSENKQKTIFFTLYVLIIIILLTMSSCKNQEKMKKCCEETAKEVYIYEGLYVDCENCDEID